MRIQSLILQYVVSLVFFVVNLFAIYLLLRGHNDPGGGFIAGLISGLSVLLLALAYGFDELKRLLRVDPLYFVLVGLAISYLTAFIPTFFDQSFLQHTMWHLHLPLFGELHIGTAFAFDLGVFFVVIGVVVRVIFVLVDAMSEEGVL